MPNPFQTALLITLAVWTLCALAVRPVRIALQNGLHCMARYPGLWRIPAAFGIASAAFHFTAAIFVVVRKQENIFAWLSAVTPATTPASLSLLWSAAWLPALEGTASLFSIFTATFPLSAFCALLFLGNAWGCLGACTRVIRRRFSLFAWPAILALVICALCAVLKPALYLLLPEALAHIPFPAILTIGMASYVFELILGAFFLTYLMLMAYAWSRGLQFESSRLRRLAAHRTAVVLQWTFLIAAAATLLIALPSLAPLLTEPGAPIASQLADAGQFWGRILFAALLTIGCAVQTTLVFHNASLSSAIRASLEFLRTHLGVVSAFFTAAFALFLLLQAGIFHLGRLFGPDSALVLGVQAIEGFLTALIAGWLVAAWVCLYKSLTSGRKDILF